MGGDEAGAGEVARAVRLVLLALSAGFFEVTTALGKNKQRPQLGPKDAARPPYY